VNSEAIPRKWTSDSCSGYLKTLQLTFRWSELVGYSGFYKMGISAGYGHGRKSTKKLYKGNEKNLALALPSGRPL